MPKFDGDIEKTYQKKTQLEHILLRPDSYIGTTEQISEKLWVYDSKTNSLINKEISYVPGFYKIFDEILVNAVDNIVRDLKMNTIKVEIKNNSISIYNNGLGIPISIHKKYNIYVPELIFGQLLTSSNYDDSKKKITGGRNGYGAKLTNVFSKKFIVETGEKKTKKKYRQEFSDNMTKRKDPEITNYNGEDYTKIYYEPDFKKFSMKEIDEDTLSLLIKRIYDVAGTTPSRIKVYYNNELIKINDFNQYIDLYIKDKYFDEENKIIYPKIMANPNERWEVGFSMTDGTFQQVSYVNGICTSKGGTHVNYILDQITNRISDFIKKKNKDIKMNLNQIKQNLWVFINCKIENPSFDSQTKECLTSKVENFGSKFNLTEKFIKEVLKSNIVTNILEFAKVKAKVKLHKALTSNIKKSSRLLGIEKLEDANLAGTKDYEKCTLILTEGDSAKALAMSGIEVVGRDYYGVFPLRGKVLNVRGAKDKQIIQNEEIQNIIKILGLKIGNDYSKELKGMRYGHLLIMADQDYDGSHIKGLIINFIHFFWPSLIKRGDFLQEFITPIVKATKDKITNTFYTIKEYLDWFKNNKHNGFKIKYYKGLGTSTSKDAKEYFMNINKLKLKFNYVNNEDDKSIELAFSKVDSEARKNWLLNFDRFNTYLDQSKGSIRYKDFINEELIFFSNYDNIRSIPSMMDGLKPSERKILYSCFKRKLTNELKVAQLSGYVAEVSSYHHGEQSLSGTITALAQDFVGSNNVNLLVPEGQFGNRYNGIKGAASPRYIYTFLNNLTRKIFKEEDDNLLLYNVDEGMKIEPVWYVPILPMILVNGCDGIGTGWSTSIPCFNPLEISDNLKRKLRGENFIEIKPWYKGFSGDIIKTNDNKECRSYIVNGKININLEKEVIEINELPVKVFTRDYKNFLEKNHADNKEVSNKDFEIEDIKEYHTDNKISFVIKLTESSFNNIKNKNNEELLKLFKLTSVLNTSNMVLFNHENKIHKYNLIEEIFEEFYNVRLNFYEKRKKYLLDKIGFALEKNENKKNFITMFINGEINFKNSKNKKDIISILKKNGFKSNGELKNKYKEAFKINSTEIILNEENENENNNDFNDNDFDYLMNLNIWNLTPEKINELEDLIKNEKNEYEKLKKSNVQEIWIKDLEMFEIEYLKILNELDGKNKETENKIKIMKEKYKDIKKKRKKNKKKIIDEESEEDSSENEDKSDEMSIYSDEEDSSKKKVVKKRKINDNSNINVKSNEKNNNSTNKKNSRNNSSNKKTNNNNNNNNTKNIINSRKKKVIELNESDEENNNNIININKEENLKPEAKSLLKNLNLKKTPIKEKNNVDITKLPLKERLALKAKQGKIDEYLKALQKPPEIKSSNKKNKKEETKNEEDEIELNEILGKKSKKK